MTNETFQKALNILMIITISSLIIFALILSSYTTAYIVHTIRNEILEAPRITEKQ